MSSLHRRIASRLRFRDYVEQAPDRLQAGPDSSVRAAARQAPLADATVSRAVPALDRLSPDDRAGARGCLDGDALEVDPAGGDQGGDRLRHPGASLAARARGVEPRRAPGIAQGPPGGPGGPGPGRLGAGQASGALEPLADHEDDQARSGRGPPQGLRTRDAPALAPGLPAQVGRGFEPVARGCRRSRRADLQHALQPLAGRRPVFGRSGRPGLGRLAALAGRAFAGAGRLLLRPALEPPHPPLVPRRPQGTPGDRQPDDRGLRRHARGAGLRPAKKRVGAVHGPEPFHGPARASRLVALAVDRAALGIRPAHGLGRALALWRHAGHRRPALAGRPDDVPGLSGHAPGADGRAGHERHPVPEQPRRLRPRARPAGRAARDGRLPRHAHRLQERGRRADHSPERRLHLSRHQPPGAARHRPRGRARRDDRAGRPERIGQDHALQPDRPVLRPDLTARSRSMA